MKAEFRNVGGTNTVLVAVHGNNVGYPMSAIVKNGSAGTIFVGHAGVTTSNGFPLAFGESLEVDLVNEGLYGVATVTTSINVLRRGD